MKQLSEIYMPKTTEVSLIVPVLVSKRHTSSSDTSKFFLKNCYFSRSSVFVNAVVPFAISTRTDGSNSKEAQDPFPFTSCSSVGSLSDAVFLIPSGCGSNDPMLCVLYVLILPCSCFWKFAVETNCAVAFRLRIGTALMYKEWPLHHCSYLTRSSVHVVSGPPEHATRACGVQIHAHSR